MQCKKQLKWRKEAKENPENLIIQDFRDYLGNADRGTRTLTPSRVADFESAASAIPPHPHQ